MAYTDDYLKKICFWSTHKEHHAFKRACINQGTTMSDVLRKAAADFVEMRRRANGEE